MTDAIFLSRSESRAPSSHEAEQALLGSVLFDNEAYHLADGIEAKHFFEPAHQRLWDAMADRIARGLGAELIWLWKRMETDPGLIEMGGLGYLGDLVANAPPAFMAKGHADVVLDQYVRRSLKAAAAEISAIADDASLPAWDHLETGEQLLYGLSEKGPAGGGFVAFGDALDKAVDIAAAAFDRKGAVAGLSTGLIDLDSMLGGLHPSDLVILAGRPSMGKAQPLSAKVLMRDGSWKAMGDLRLGDELASTDGAPSRIAGVYPQGHREVFKVTLGDGRSTRACSEHLWAIESCKLAGPKVVQTSCLAKMLQRERFQRRVSLPLASGHFGSDDGLLIDPWFLGALIGNGGMTGSALMFSTADAATLYRVQKVVGAEAVVSGGGDYDYRLNQSVASGLTGALKQYGLWGKGSPEKFIPAPYKAASRESRMELLRGLLDTDGWVETFGAVRYATSSPRLAADIADLVRSIGGVCTTSVKKPTFTHKGEKREGLDSYVLNISHPDRASLLSLKRKQRRCGADMRFRAPTVTSIEPDGEELVQCIRVTHPSSLYITDDYIVTHNTALATNIAYSAANTGGDTAFFSLEMSEEQLAMRILAEASGVPGDRTRRGQIDAGEFGRIRDARDEIRRAPLHIDATGGLPLGKLCARARRLHRKKPLKLIVVDYLQLVTVPGMGTGQRVQEVSAITQGLKALAKELSVPVLALSQLSRQVENREDKRPQLADLRESGSIEQDADMVMFVYREAYYLGRTEPRTDTPEHLTWQEDMDRCAHEAEVIIGKQRHGPIGTVKLHFNSDLTKFSNLAREGRFHPREHGAARLPYGGDE